MNLKELIRKLFCRTEPVWAHGLECEICRMTFVSAEAHRKHAKARRTIKKHQGKIPVLRGN